ncbi:RQC-minor-2 family DNA-binding protein [Metabacillus litoralis]|uniref:RQC-minor-2 family DNA-binding protein n=1 Tax=Metabacillus litoralis TaxID=152268 RepID=UPI001CFF248B|nr:RQC-minor-2 family DNA-binding protein [Metabacillus litoralis]
MSLLNHSYYFQEYPSIVISPIGKKNKNIRSIGHKNEKSLLSRINEALLKIELSEDERKKLRRFLQLKDDAFFPVMMNKNEKIEAKIIKPEYLLWQSFSPNHGIPHHKDSFYKQDISILSNEDLSRFLVNVLKDYLFCAVLNEKTEQSWELFIKKAYDQHPFVQLEQEKREIVHAVEKANRSPLLSILSSPEDVTYWRHRVEIVLRPYRNLPVWCDHDKNLEVLPIKEAILCSCLSCQTEYIYHVKEEKILLENDPNMEQANKRIATIEKQFNDIIDKNSSLVSDLEFLSYLKQHIDLSEIVQLIKNVHSLPFTVNIENQLSLKLVTELSRVIVPIERSNSNLLWVSQFEIPNITFLSELKRYSFEEIKKKVPQLIDELKYICNELPFKPNEILIKINNKTLSYLEVAHILNGILTLCDFPLHIIAQIMKGRTSYSLREQNLNHHFLYRFLESWEEKSIQKLLKRLEKDSWIKKKTRGYEILEKGNSLIDILINNYNNN